MSQTPIKNKLSIAELPGVMFRQSLAGKATKFLITNPASMQARDFILDKTLSPDQEHLKRYAQYLTGGVKDNVITDLPAGVRSDVKASHLKEDYPERRETIWKDSSEVSAEEKKIQDQLKSGEITFEESQKQWNSLIFGKDASKANPGYNPESNLLSTYGTQSGYQMVNAEGKAEFHKGSNRTLGSIGHAQFTPNADGSYTLTDKYDVDHDPKYKSGRGTHADLQEGGQVASRMYVVAKFLGINKEFDYKVNFSKEELKINQRKK